MSLSSTTRNSCATTTIPAPGAKRPVADNSATDDDAKALVVDAAGNAVDKEVDEKDVDEKDAQDEDDEEDDNDDDEEEDDNEKDAEDDDDEDGSKDDDDDDDDDVDAADDDEARSKNGESATTADGID